MSVEGDLFGIEGRLREIDGGYFLVRNRKKGRFEVHCAGQAGGTLALVVPYGRLDERTVRLVRRTRAERAERLMKEVSAENERLAREELRKAVKGAEVETERLMKEVSAENERLEREELRKAAKRAEVAAERLMR